MPRNDALSKGLDLYEQGRYRDALMAFEQASRENSRHKILSDTRRAAALKKLDDLADTLNASKDFTDWQEHRRSSRLSPRAGKLSASFKMVELALELVKPTDAERRAMLAAFREEILDAMKPSPSQFDKLPVELQIEILSNVIDGSRTRMVTLIKVCPTWKDLITRTPSCFHRFILDGRTTQKKADAWLKLAKGVVTSLRVDDPSLCYKKQSKLRNASKDFWLKLKELELTNASLFKYLPAETIRQLRLRSLVVDVDYFPREDLWEGIRSLDTSATYNLSIAAGRCLIELEGLSFSRLTSLRLDGNFRPGPFFELLRRNSALHTLILTRLYTNDYFSVVQESIELPVLRRIELDGINIASKIFRCVKVPRLGALHLANFGTRFNTACCMEDIISQGIASLTEICLYKCNVSSPILVSFLQSSPSLKLLKLSRCTFDDGDINSVIKALYEPAKDASSSIPCPKLQHLDVSSSPDLESGPLISFVKSHQANSSATPVDKYPATPASSEHARNPPLPILSLNINDCPLIRQGALLWLEETVPSVEMSYW
ncbi:hypothetical protein A7U60_g1701 [Sanghuangporus baumii]|uniref:F-box domain-containing protein n=1 Tax=Sanghuangporus baumii TaxID=108892 RepID=A0A9Q5I3Y3_SANBA|nr:hypothetical protein A7U60_g1701 [Sanghuangporus baumii]